MKQQVPPGQRIHPAHGRPQGARLRWSWGKKKPPDADPLFMPSPHRVPTEVWPLLRYLDELEEWSHHVWSGAGVKRPWLPEVVRNQLREQWWVQARVPPPMLLRERIAMFWAGVIPWLAWNLQAERLPDPPADPGLLTRIVAGLDREIHRMGRPEPGNERVAALRSAIHRLELLGSVPSSRRLSRPA